ncbi:hypothetical protein B0H19DRAFT_1074133 [Mycena capillaripes]|nr:hypothetical protein B0H19DRAFT_1074133 [Mycena capillaripes]
MRCIIKTVINYGLRLLTFLLPSHCTLCSVRLCFPFLDSFGLKPTAKLSMVCAVNNTTVSADLRVFTPSITPLLPDETVAFADQLPDNRTSMVFGVGRVTGSPQTLDDGHGSRVISLTVADFVRGETKSSTLQVIFEYSTARWTRTPIPHTNSVIQFYGLCRDLSPAGLLRIKAESVALNISSNASAPSDESQSPSQSTGSAPVTPSKRRKFASPSPPSTGPDLTPSTTISTPSNSRSESAGPSTSMVAEPPAPSHSIVVKD